VVIHNRTAAFGCKPIRLDLDQIVRRKIRVDGAGALLRRESTMNQSQSTKWMMHGEAGLFAFFTVSAFLCMFAAAKAVDAPFAFHASLSSIASLAAAFFILNRYFDRPSSPPAQEINGKPNYNMGPIKFAAAISVFWGIAGFTVGLLIASQLAWRRSTSTFRGQVLGGFGRCTHPR
jgi:hypothetical protein